MITLRLFHSTDPFRPIETRSLGGGELSIGRDPSAQWPIPDPECAVSRQHCILTLRDGGLWLRDISSNGVFLGDERRRVERDEPVPVSATETIHIGRYIIVVEVPSAANDSGIAGAGALDAPFHSPLLKECAATSAAVSVPSTWSEKDESVSPARATSDAALLDAFCAGAQLDASSFAGQDPTEVMQRIGAVYQQLVLGMGDLMSERTSLKNEYRMDRTTVSAIGNNPFKWAASQRLATDLLRERQDGFLYGPAALKASFVDLKMHLLCLVAGARAAVAASLDHLSPDQVEGDLEGRSLLFMHKTEACWRAYRKRHDGLAADGQSNADSLLNQAFRRGYEHELRRLDQLGTRS